MPQPTAEQAVASPTMRMNRPRTLAEANGSFPAAVSPRVRGYDLLEELGSGGMGIVYRARHRNLNRIVALKMLRPSSIADVESRERFRAEAEAVARLQHPNIIQVFEIGEFDGAGADVSAPFIALEYVEGGSLSQRTSVPQNPRWAAELVEKLARAVHSAHELGVVHRDLKPANVLLTRSGEPKIADFGLAKQLEADVDSAGRFVTQAGVVVGTPEYMPPEQTAGHPPTPAIDTYALGVILYELLAARVPFRGATPYETMAIAQDEEPVSPRRLQPGVPRDLETICLKCLEKSPSRRYASALALANDLRSFLDGRTIQARRTSDTEKVARWCRRNPVAAVSLAMITATVVLAFAVVYRSNLRLEAAFGSEADQRREAQSNAAEAIQNAAEAKRNADAERFEGYRAHLAAAASLFELHDSGAKRNLEACPDDYRTSWEWRHFRNRFDLSERLIEPESDGPFHRYLLAEGSRVVLTTPSRFRILNPAKGGWTEFPRPTPSNNLPAISDNGRWAAYHAEPGLVELWNLETNRATRFPRNDDSTFLCFTADGSRLMTAGLGRTVRIRDCESGRILLEFAPYPEGVRTAGYSPDGKRIVTYCRERTSLDLWDGETGRQVAKLTCGKTELNHVYFGRTRLITEEHFPQTTLKLWDLETGRFIGDMPGHENSLCAFAFSSDETRIATASMDQSAWLWNGITGKPIAAMLGHKGWVNSAAFSPDGKRLITASQDHTLRLWDGLNGTPINVLTGHDQEVHFASYTADGTKIVSISGDAVTRIWDPKRVERDGVLRGHETFIYGVAIHPDGRRAASGSWDGTARLWDLDEEKTLAKFEHGEKAIVTSVAFHPDGKLLASRTRDAVHLWDIETRKEVHRWNTPSDLYRHTRLAFSPDGKFLATGGPKEALYIWNVETRTEYAVLRGHTDVIRDVAFSPDGKFIASAGEVSDNTIRIWNVAEKREVQTLHGHTSAVYSLAFSPDGSILASGSMDDTVRLWSTTDWASVGVLKHGTHIYGLAFTPDGKRLAAACANNAIRIWDAEKWKEAVDLHGHAKYVHAVAFSKDGRLVSASGDTTLRIWGTKQPAE